MGKKKGGHYCFGCDKYLANEKFSGKGHKKHICRKCQKKGRTANNISEFDEFTGFISSFPEYMYEFLDGEWTEFAHQGNITNRNQAFISVSDQIAANLKNMSLENSLETAIYFSIAVSLFLTGKISKQKAATISNCDVTDFIYFLQSNQISWSMEEDNVIKEYQNSIDDLLLHIDRFLE